MTKDELVQHFLSEDLDKETALLIGDGAWKILSLQEIAFLQLHQDKLCVPFDKYLEALSFTLGRPVLILKSETPISF